MRHAFAPPAAVLDGGRRVETSTLLVLEALVDAGARSVRDVAEALDVTHSTASRLVSRAEDAGMVRRTPSPDSGRSVVLTLTDEGAAVRERGARHRLALLEAATGAWEPAEVEAFAALLERFAGATTPPSVPGSGT